MNLEELEPLIKKAGFKIAEQNPVLVTKLALMSKEKREEFVTDLIAKTVTWLIHQGDRNDSATEEDDKKGDTDFEGILEDYTRLFNINRLLADALGACECWGKNEDCEVCGGIGKPAWRKPEKQSFNFFVQPVLEKMRRMQKDNPRNN